MTWKVEKMYEEESEENKVQISTNKIVHIIMAILMMFSLSITFIFQNFMVK